MKKKSLTFISILLLCINWGFAQSKVLLDKTLATIGSKIILRSELHNQIADLQRQGVEIKENMQCEILEQEVVKKAMVMQAEKDSLLVSNEEIEAEIDSRLRYFISIYGGKEELEQIAGKNVYQLKEYFRLPIHEGLLARNMQKKIMESVSVTPLEVRQYFNQIPSDSLQFWESEFQIGEIVLYAKASKEDDAYALESLKEIKGRIERGEVKFETQAQLYSDDPGSKSNGGKYEVNRNDKQWDPVFFATIWRLKTGQTSSVIRSKFGYHIIQLVSHYGDDAVIRHILKTPPILDRDIKPVLTFADSIRNLLIEEKISFSQAVATYNEDDNSKFTAGLLMSPHQTTSLTIDEIDKDVITQIEKLKVGEYSPPFVFKDPKGKTGVKFLYLKSKTEPHKENLEEDYLKISQRLIEKKKMESIDNWTNKSIPTFYLNVDKEFESCSTNIEKWKADSDKIGAMF